MFKHHQHTNLLQYNSLSAQKALFAFTSTRVGGVSTGEYSSFNLGMYGHDDTVHKLANKEILAKILNINTSDIYLPHQTHSSQIAIIDANFLQKEEKEKESLLDGIDAIITDQPNIFIGIATADCVPILLYDPIHRVLASVHAGWRGIVAQLPQKVLRCMCNKYGTSPSDVLATIGPSISLPRFEVGNEVVEAFRNACYNIDEISKINTITNKYHIDLWASCKSALLYSNIASQNIEIAELCTYENNDLFFSARRQGIHSGRMITGGILL